MSVVIPRPAASVPVPAVLEVSGLSVAAGSLGLVHDVTFALSQGERVGLIGESGSGKSLTGLALLGLLPDGLTASGSVRVAGTERDLVGASERELARLRGRALAMVFQQPMSALNPTMRVGDQVAETMLVHGTMPDRTSARRRAVELLDQVRLPDPGAAARAYPHQLSGGQRQRVVLAIALANDPALLVCDEPTTALDVTVQALVLDLIVRGVRARDAAMLLITHDLAVVGTTCERVLVMYGGRIVESGTVEEVFTRPRHRYTAGLLAASDLAVTDRRGRLLTIPGTVPPAGAFPAGCVFRTRCEAADSACEVLPPWTPREGSPAASATQDPESARGGFACRHPVLAPPSPSSSPSTSSPSTSSPSTSSPSTSSPPVASSPPSGRTRTGDGGGTAAVVLRDVVRDYRRPRRSLRAGGSVVHALRGVSLEIAAGERFGIVGESGCGKSTLLRIVAGLDAPSSGEVRVEGTDIAGLPERRLRFLRERLQLVFQDPTSSLDPRMRVGDIVAEPLVAQRVEARARVEQLLDEVGLGLGAGQRYPHQFSGGQRQRVSIARALAPRPGLLLADEPVSALDVSVRAQVLNLLADLVDQLDLTLVFVSHDLSVVRHLCTRVAVMQDGQVVEVGTAEQVWTDPQHPYTRRLLAAVPTLEKALSGATTAELVGGDEASADRVGTT